MKKQIILGMFSLLFCFAVSMTTANIQPDVRGTKIEQNYSEAETQSVTIESQTNVELGIFYFVENTSDITVTKLQKSPMTANSIHIDVVLVNEFINEYGQAKMKLIIGKYRDIYSPPLRC